MYFLLVVSQRIPIFMLKNRYLGAFIRDQGDLILKYQKSKISEFIPLNCQTLRALPCQPTFLSRIKQPKWNSTNY
jgi:hypothetical protein